MAKRFPQMRRETPQALPNSVLQSLRRYVALANLMRLPCEVQIEPNKLKNENINQLINFGKQ
eukprot:9663771-Alexandrium_andersonii.AAC.1